MKTRRNILLLTLMLVTLAFFSCNNCGKKYASADLLVEDLSANLEVIKVEQLKAKLDSFEMFYLIDVREANEHYYGFIPGSIHVCCGSIAFKMDNNEFWENEMTYTPEKTDEIVVYCKKGKRSVLAASLLDHLGYENVKFIEGGWKKWELTYPLMYEKKLENLGHTEENADAGGC
ncbi:MAG: rhodanese-like domain-containing protein [Bacteroidota bacterium]|nr:rhodanese-like domain-containing protein [Bacteroidota bacterium]